MTISNASRTAGPFIGDGVRTSFPFSYKVFSRGDVLVARTVTATSIETVLTLDADYAVTLNTDQNSSPGGTIVLAAALAVGTSLAATSNIAALQPLDLTNNGGFYPTAINQAFDRVVILVQQLAARVGVGALNVGAAASIAAISSALSTLTSSAGAGLVNWIQNLAGAVMRSVQDKLRDTVSVKDFGAKGDGVTDDTAAFVAAIAAADVVIIPPGNYLISKISINKSNFSLIGSGYEKSILTTTAAANVAISVASTANVSGLLLQDFKIQGNATGLGGIALGSAGFYCAIPILHRVHIWDFALSGANNGFGVQLNQVQNATIHNCWIYRNRHGVQRLNVGYCTSTHISGKSGYLGVGYIGLYIDGQCDDLYIDDVVIEGNDNSGIIVTANAVLPGRGSCIYINGAYLEANNASGLGAIYVVGGAGAYQDHVLVIDRCNFAANTGYYINIDRVIATIKQSKIAPNNVLTTANTNVRFEHNRYPNGADYLAQYRALLGNITVADTQIPATGTDPNQVNMVNAIQFPATPRLVADQNTLDDYKERIAGQWVPVATSLSGTVTSIAGYYVKIGRLVHFEIVIVGTSLASSWGATNISLPVTTAIASCCSFFNGSNGLGGSAYIDASTDKVLLPTIAAANAVLVINGSYIADE